MSAMVSEMILAVVLTPLVVSVLLLLFFYLHVKRYDGASPTNIRSSLIRFVLAPDQGTVTRRGLDPSVIQDLPVTVFRSEDLKEGLECAVCLCELSEGERARLLSECNHGFHLECIDMWFRSNTTCPLCRSAVASEPLQSAELVEVPPVQEVAEDENSAVGAPGIRSVAAGSPRQRSSSSEGSSSGMSEGMLVIEIRRRVDRFPPLPLSRQPEEEIRSPTLAKLRSLRGLVSWGGKGIGSPRVGDIEQGAAGM